MPGHSRCSVNYLLKELMIYSDESINIGKKHKEIRHALIETRK